MFDIQIKGNLYQIVLLPTVPESMLSGNIMIKIVHCIGLELWC